MSIPHSISSLPVEIFQLIVSWMIPAVGLYNTTAVRLVDKAFNEACVRAMIREGWLAPTTGKYDEGFPRNLYAQYLLWRLASPRGQKSALGLALMKSIGFYNYYRIKHTQLTPLSADELLHTMCLCVADHVPLRQLRLRPPQVRDIKVNMRRVVQGVLVLACAIGDTQKVQLMLRDGVNPNYGTVHLASPIVAAARAGKTDIVELLLNHGADIVGLEETAYGTKYLRAPLPAACEGGHSDIVKILLHRASTEDDLDLTPDYAWAAKYCLQWGRMELFHLIYPLLIQESRYPVIVAAASFGIMELIDLLSKPQSQGQQSLTMAARNGRLPMVQELINRNIYQSKRGDDTTFYLAVAYRRHEVVKLLIQDDAYLDGFYVFTECYHENERHFCGTALMVAAENEDVDMLRILIDAGVRLRVRNQGIKAYKTVTRLGNKEAMSLLFDVLLKESVKINHNKKRKNRIMQDEEMVEAEREEQGEVDEEEVEG